MTAQIRSVTLQTTMTRGKNGGYTLYLGPKIDGEEHEPHVCCSTLAELVQHLGHIMGDVYKESIHLPSPQALLAYQPHQAVLTPPPAVQERMLAPATPPPQTRQAPQPPPVPPREDYEPIPTGIVPDRSLENSITSRLNEIARTNGRVASMILVAGFTLALMARTAIGA
jgi:hypothetical protein